jgi:hypothetical protein
MNERDLDQPLASALDALAQRQQPDARFVDTLGAQLRDMAAARAQASAADDADRSTGYVETDKPLGALRRLLGLDRPRGALRPSLVVLGALLACGLRCRGVGRRRLSPAHRRRRSRSR